LDKSSDWNLFVMTMICHWENVANDTTNSFTVSRSDGWAGLEDGVSISSQSSFLLLQMDDPSLIGADNERLFNLLFYYFYTTDKYNDMQPGRWQGRRPKLSTNGTRMEGAGSCWLAQVSHKTRRRKWWWTIHLRYIRRVNDVCCPTVEQQQTAGHQHSAPSISSPPARSLLAAAG
jgi:hypothetical protein